MDCLNCEITNQPDARFCRRCGKSIRRCAGCAVAQEPDALFCRRCGKPVEQEGQAEASANAAPLRAAAHGTDADGDVDFTTKVSPKRVVPIAKGRGIGRGVRRALRVASYVVVVLALAAAEGILIATWPNAQSQASASREEALRADLENLRKTVANTRDEDRKRLLQEIGVILAKTKAEERKETREEIREAVAKEREEARKTLGVEIAKAVAKAREQDHGFVIAELSKLKAKSKNREFTRNIEKVIAIFRKGGKPVAGARREEAENKARPRPQRRRSDVNAD